MGRMKTLLMMLAICSPMFACNKVVSINQGIESSLKFEEALMQADAIFLGVTDRVEVLTPTVGNNFNRRSLVKVLDLFKGKNGQTERFVYFKTKVSPQGNPPGSALAAGKYGIYFIKNESYPAVLDKMGSFDLPYYPDKMEYAPIGEFCKLEALRAYKKKRPLEEVLKIAKSCKRNKP